MGRSTDYGLTFETIFSVYDELPNAMVVKLIISPDYATDRLLAALVINGPKGISTVFISKNSGSTWKQIEEEKKRYIQKKDKSQLTNISFTIDNKPKQFNGSGKYVAKLPEYAKGDTRHGRGFSRDAIVGTPDGKLIMGLLVGGIVQGNLFNNK